MINFFFLKKKKTINLNQNYKKEKRSTREKERERESTYIFLRGKYRLNGRNDIEFIQNKMERRIVKI